MKKFMILAAALLLSAKFASAGDIGIATGAPTGTNYPMGEDIVR